MLRQIVLLIALVLVFPLAIPVMAGIKGGEVTVSPFAGTYVYDGSQLLEPSFAAGMRLGYNLNRNWGLEGQFMYANLRGDTKRGGEYNYSGDLLYHFFVESTLVPYMLIGG